MGDRLGAVEALLKQTNETVRSVYDSARCQKDSLENIASLGRRLADASGELAAVADISAENVTEALDDETQAACREFFPVMEHGLVLDPGITGGNPEEHDRLLRVFMERHPIVEAVWTNALNGRFIRSIPPSGIANAAMRDWFRAAVNGEKYISSIYISGITKNRCVTVAMPYRDEAGGIVGVVGVDLNLEKLQKSR
jgi:methyl-accepting chemotaxis protein